MEPRETPTLAARALLSPWLDSARRAVCGSLNELATARQLEEDLWISWQLEEIADSADVWIPALEAVELLDLYVRVDYRAAWAWLLDALEMPLYVALLDELPNPIYPKHSISWTGLGSSEIGHGSCLERAERLVFAIPEELHTSQFRLVRDEMMRRWGRERREPAERIRVCLDVVLEELVEHDEDGAARALKELEGLALRAEDPSRCELLEQFQRSSLATLDDEAERAGVRPPDVFHLECIEITTGDAVLTDPMLQSLRAIYGCGVRISSLTIDRGVQVLDRFSLLPTIKFLRTTVVPADSRFSTMLIDNDMEVGLFQAFCSALAVTQSVHDARLAMTHPPDQYWSWIAYAFLSGDVANRIEWVHLWVARLTMRDVEQVERVLRASDPIAALAPPSSIDANSFQRDREVIDVRPNTNGLIRTDHADATSFFRITIDVCGATGLRVVDDALSQTHVCVLYPGAGLCWVRRDAIVARRRLPPLQQASPPRIELEIGHETSLPALLGLIRLVGPHTKILMLFATNSAELSDEFMRDVLAACPQLERLELTYVTLTSLAWLTEGSNGSRLASLRIKHVEMLDGQGYKPLFAALRDTEDYGGLSHTLRELAVHDYVEDVRPYWPDLLNMLSANRRLERFLVRVRVDDDSDDVEPLAEQLDTHNGEPIQGQARPFPLRSRLALLSVFTRRPELRALHEPILTIVWALAAPNKRRVCGVMGRPPRDTTTD